VAGLARGGKLKLIGVTTPAPLPQFSRGADRRVLGLPGFQFNSCSR